MIWTITLVGAGVTALWFAPRHWWGWAIAAASEVLWFTYALSIGAPSLAIMAVVWFLLNTRAAYVAREMLRAAIVAGEVAQ